jgi:hypothetical protein
MLFLIKVLSSLSIIMSLPCKSKLLARKPILMLKKQDKDQQVELSLITQLQKLKCPQEIVQQEDKLITERKLLNRCQL